MKTSLQARDAYDTRGVLKAKPSVRISAVVHLTVLQVNTAEEHLVSDRSLISSKFQTPISLSKLY